MDSISLACVKDKEWPEFSRYKPEKSVSGGRSSNWTGNSGNRSPISASGHNGSGKFIKQNDVVSDLHLKLVLLVIYLLFNLNFNIKRTLDLIRAFFLHFMIHFQRILTLFLSPTFTTADLIPFDAPV